MPKAGKRDPEKERFWRDKVERQRASGLSQIEFCAREGVNSGTFNTWINILHRRDEEAREAAAAARRAAAKKKKSKEDSKRKQEPLFVPVGSPSNGNNHQLPNSTVAEIVFAGGRIMIFAGAEIALVQAVIQALKERASAGNIGQHEDISVHTGNGHAQEF
jgi:hypothetical protein